MRTAVDMPIKKFKLQEQNTAILVLFLNERNLPNESALAISQRNVFYVFEIVAGKTDAKLHFSNFLRISSKYARQVRKCGCILYCLFILLFIILF